MRDLSPAVKSGLIVFLTIFAVDGLHTPSLWAGPPPAAAVAGANSPIDVSIRPGAESYVLLHVEPYAACLVTEPGQKTPEAGRPLFSEDNGVLLFAVSTRSTAGSEQLIVLDCSDEKGAASRHLVKLSVGGAPTANAFDSVEAATSAWVSAHDDWPVRPPLAGDPLLPTQYDLTAAGYPPRPDPTRAPRDYNTWLSAVSQPARIQTS